MPHRSQDLVKVLEPLDGLYFCDDANVLAPTVVQKVAEAFDVRCRSHL